MSRKPQGRRPTRPEDLGASWASEAYNKDNDQDYTPGTDDDSKSEGVSDTDSIEEQGINVSNVSLKTGRPPNRKANNRSQTLTTNENMSPTQGRSPKKLQRETIAPRRSSRMSSRANSLEPSFIMPSPMDHQQNATEDSWIETSEPSAGRYKKLVGSGVVPSIETMEPQTRSTGVRRRGRKRKSPASFQMQEEPFDILGWLWQVLSPIINYVLHVGGIAMHMLKPVFAFAIVIIGAIIALQAARSSATQALQPLCILPGSSYIFGFCESRQRHPGNGPIEFEQLLNAQSAFEDVLSSSTDIASLPYNMKRSEASIRDLRSIIQYSTLPSRNELAFEFSSFIEAARQASKDLSSFDSRIARAVDAILSTNRWTLAVLSSVSASLSSRGSLTVFLSNLNPFANPLSHQEKVLTQYLRHTAAIEEQVQAVILEAQGLLYLLNALDERLDVIASIAARDGYTVSDSRAELLYSLWTKLGGNRSSMQKLDEHLALLRSVGAYQRTAWNHVSATIIKLQEIAAQLEDLRERVAAPGVVGIRADLPLEVHIENIQLGLERLDGVRMESRRVHGDLYRQMTLGSDAKEGKLVEAPGSTGVAVV